MRTSSQSYEDAITIPESLRATGRLTAYKSRVYFDAYTDNAPEYALAEGEINGYPLPEAICYNSDLEKFVTISIKTNGDVMLHIEGEATPVRVAITGTPIEADPICRPGIFENLLWYFYSGNWYKATYNPDLVLLGTENCIVSQNVFSTIPTGAIHPLTDNTAIIFYIDEGGIRPVYIASDGSEHKHQGRLFNPTHVYSGFNTEDVELLQYTGATLLGEKIFVYSTTHKGSIKGASYEFAEDGLNGAWSDFFVSVPEDLSVAEIGNVFVENSRVFMCVRFYRKEEFVSETKYTLLLWSQDGITFSIDRKTLVSTINLRFLAASCGDNLVFSSTNRYYSTTKPYQLIGESAEFVSLIIDSISGSPNSGWSVKIKASSEEYLDNPLLITGAYSKIEAGVNTTEGTEYVKFHDVVISDIRATLEDGSRGYNINFVPDAMWHTSMMTHPFYMELQGKQAILDRVQELNNLYRVETQTGINWSLSCDFWTQEVIDAGGLVYQTHAGEAATDHWCKDLKEFCVDYPLFDNSETIEIRLYGWSRAGISSGAPGPNPVDNTPTNTNNDDFYALMLVEDNSGIQTTYISLIGELDSTYKHPEQTWFEENVRPGSYPVIYNMANPGEGKKLIKVGIRVISPSGNTTYYTERIEVPGIVVSLLPLQENVNMQLENLNTDLLPFKLYCWNGISVDPNPMTSYELEINDLTTSNLLTIGVFGSCAWIITPVDDGLGEREVTIILDMEITNGAVAGDPLNVVVYPVCLNDTDAWDIPPDHSDFEEYSTFGSYEANATEIQSGQSWSTTITRKGKLKELSSLPFGFSWRNYYNATQNTGKISISIISETYSSSVVEGESPKKLANTTKGVPQIFFSQRPYSAWNFDCYLRGNVIGSYSKLGLVGMGVDGNSYLVGYMEVGKICLAVVRNGIKTILEEYGFGPVTNKTYDLRFWHRDGEFGIEYKLTSTATWPIHGSQLYYSWKENDGSIATSDDIFHVGIWSIIDPPKFRTTGFVVTQDKIGVLPLDLNPATGKTDMEFFVVDYGAWVDVGGNGSIFHVGIPDGYLYGEPVPPTTPLGPFQLRLKGAVEPPYSSDPPGGGGREYINGGCIEFYLFKWLDGTTENQMYFVDTDTYHCCLSSGWYIPANFMQWKVWITTSGELIWIRERCRTTWPTGAGLWQLDSNFNGTLLDKVWITNTIPEVAPQKGNKASGLYPEGTFVYLHNNDKVNVFGFTGISGDHDYSIAGLLDMLCKIAGTSTVFPGDNIISVANISESEISL